MAKTNKKTCFIPLCKSTSENAPNKAFLVVPRNLERRKLWYSKVEIKHVAKGARYCCKDHFDLKNDCINFLYSKKVRKTKKSGYIQLKKEIVPHLFLKAPSFKVNFSQFDEESEDDDQDESQGTNKISSVYITTDSSSLLNSSASLPIEEKSFELSSISSDEIADSDHFKTLRREHTLTVIEMHPRFYLGLPNEVYHLVKLITSSKSMMERDILITLKKIRLNDSYFRLGIDFELSTSSICKIYNKSIYHLEDVMRHFIYWPDKKTILKFMPIPFRLRYSNVVSIIDCFEISIEKPSNTILQAMTWSSYKNANTIKYLITSTPYGFVNFVSVGFGGRASDLIIVENSGYLKKLPQQTSVLADRDFKHLSSVLSHKNVNLVRPASVSEKQQLTDREVRESRNISALRIHIERVISRIREFHLLSLHAQVDIHSLGSLNAAVTIACGIINIQPELIKMNY